MKQEFGTHHKQFDLDQCGLTFISSIYYNLTEGDLYEKSLQRKEATLTSHGALRALTGQHTGRSATDKFTIRDETTEDHIWWNNNKDISPERFENLYYDIISHAKGRDLFVQDLIGGADKKMHYQHVS